MTVKSYLAFADDSKLEEFENDVKKIGGCELHPSDGKEVFILVTEANSENDEAQILEQINGISSLKCLSLVSAFSEKSLNPQNN